MGRTTVAKVLSRFKADGFVNTKRAVKQCGGRKRRIIGSPELERELLSNKVLQKMAPLSISRRKDFIRQKYGVEATYGRLRRFYLQHNLTYRVSSTSWRVEEEELAALNEERR